MEENTGERDGNVEDDLVRNGEDLRSRGEVLSGVYVARGIEGKEQQEEKLEVLHCGWDLQVAVNRPLVHHIGRSSLESLEK